MSSSPSFPAGHLVSFVCLSNYGSRFSFNICICVVSSLFIILPQVFVFSFLAFFSCRRHLRSVSLSSCLALISVFMVSVYPSSRVVLWLSVVFRLAVSKSNKSLCEASFFRIDLQHRTITCTVGSPSSPGSNALISSKRHKKYLSMPLL